MPADKELFIRAGEQLGAFAVLVKTAVAFADSSRNLIAHFTDYSATTSAGSLAKALVALDLFYATYPGVRAEVERLRHEEELALEAHLHARQKRAGWV